MYDYPDTDKELSEQEKNEIKRKIAETEDEIREVKSSLQ
jgi:hypothetical protein